MKRKTSPQRRAGTPVRSKGWLDSCDYCASQEDGGHYCLLHSRTMKNMDTLRCSDWTPKPEPKKSNTKAVGTGPAAGPGTHQPLVGGDHGR